MNKAILWVAIAKDGSGWFSDDAGGNLFVSEEQARRALRRHGVSLDDVGISLCGLDDDLGQMGKLYNERSNKSKGLV